jgi:hypothetical protein
MSRGGYIVIIGFLMMLMIYQNNSNERMIDRYVSLIENKDNSDFSADEIKDSVSEEISVLRDSINKVEQLIVSSKKTSDTIIKKTYIKNIYVVPNVEETKTSAEDINSIESVLTNSE